MIPFIHLEVTWDDRIKQKKVINQIYTIVTINTLYNLYQQHHSTFLHPFFSLLNLVLYQETIQAMYSSLRRWHQVHKHLLQNLEQAL